MGESLEEKIEYYDYGWDKELKSDEEMAIAKEPVPGWDPDNAGLFCDSYPQYAYTEDWTPDSDTPYFGPPRKGKNDDKAAEIPIRGNMDNIKLIKRLMGVRWPEFSWLTAPDMENPEESRCYQKFAPYISRIGYTNTGQIYSIICPQQGVYSEALGLTMNVEVTVGGTRGWVNEDKKDAVIAADMTVHATIWFSGDENENELAKGLINLMKKSGQPFPFSKKDAMIIQTHSPKDKSSKIFPLRKGTSPYFKVPDFASHEDEAWAVSNIQVAWGKVVTKSKKPLVNDFYDLVVKLFNLKSGNMILENNILTWNLWMTAPILADYDEWKYHAQFWRKSIDVDHGRSPTGMRTKARMFDGSDLNDGRATADEEVGLIEKYLEKHLKQAAKSCFGCF